MWPKNTYRKHFAGRMYVSDEQRKSWVHRATAHEARRKVAKYLKRLDSDLAAGSLIIAEDLHLRREDVERALAELVEAGTIVIQMNDPDYGHFYQIKR